MLVLDSMLVLSGVGLVALVGVVLFATGLKDFPGDCYRGAIEVKDR